MERSVAVRCEKMLASRTTRFPKGHPILKPLIAASLCFVAFVLDLSAATFFVSFQGNDAADGTSPAAAWRTIQRAADTLEPGDTVLIGPGDYAEYVATRRAGSSADLPITLKANPENDPSDPAILRALRLDHPFIVVEGLTFRFASDAHLPWRNAWASSIRIENDADGCVVRNNTIRDAARVIASDLRFESSENALSSDSSDFRAAGFVPGSHLYIGSCGLAPHWPTNHNTRWMVRQISADGHTLFVTNNVGDSFQPDPGTYWGIVHGGNGGEGHYGILFVRASGRAAAQCQIIGNTFSNLVGAAISLSGTDTLVQSNRFTRLHSYRPFVVQGSNLIIRDNLIKDCPNILWYQQSEIKSLTHPAGAEWLDYQGGMISAFSPGSTNNLIEHNWFENLENQLGLAMNFTDSYGIYFRSNVFVGVSEHFSGGRSDMHWVNNTFYRCAFDFGISNPLVLGGRAPAQSGYLIVSNLFVDCGDHRGRLDEGWFSISANASDPQVDWNYVAGAEITGWEAKRSFTDPHGINGGDPLFRDPENPLGADGLPFTDDDGLQPLPESPAARFGLGALPPFAPSFPVAHFTVASPTGWFDRVDGSYDPAWVTNTPFARGRKIRPYTTPDALGTVPVTVVFSAAGSFRGQAQNDDTAITGYGWSFGDGTSEVTFTPTVSHTYTTPGVVTVTLGLGTTNGTALPSTRTFRLLPAISP